MAEDRFRLCNCKKIFYFILIIQRDFKYGTENVTKIK